MLTLQLLGCGETAGLGRLSKGHEGSQGSVTDTLGHFSSQLLVPNPAAQDSPLDQPRPGVTRHEGFLAISVPHHLPGGGWEPAACLFLSHQKWCIGVHQLEKQREPSGKILGLKSRHLSLGASLALLSLSFSICAMSQLLWVTKAVSRSSDLHDSGCGKGWPYF